MKQIVCWVRNIGSETFETLADNLGQALAPHRATFEIENEGLPEHSRRIIISPSPHSAVTDEIRPLSAAKAVFKQLGFLLFWQDSRETRPREHGEESAH